MKAVLFCALSLLPAPAFASFECMILDQCGGGACEPYEGAPFLIEEVGDVWQVTSEGKQSFEGYSTTTIDLEGAVSIVLPPQDGMSGLISIFPTGEMLFTAHAFGDSAVAITATGNCMTEGG